MKGAQEVMVVMILPVEKLKTPVHSITIENMKEQEVFPRNW